MAEISSAVTTASTSNATAYVSDPFTPAAGDLLVVFVEAAVTVDAGGLASSVAGKTFSKIGDARFQPNNNTLYAFIADQFASAEEQTVEFSCAGDSANGCVILGVRIAGMSNSGMAAIRQFAAISEQEAATTPAVPLAAGCLAVNPVLGALAQSSSGAVDPPAGWPPLGSGSYNSPSRRLTACGVDEDFDDDTVLWSSDPDAGYAAFVVEFDAAGGEGEPMSGTIRTGANAVNAIKIGSVDVSRVYLGGAEVWPGTRSSPEAFTVSGNFVVPEGVTEITVKAWGAGGGGRGGNSGGGGGFAQATVSVTPEETLRVEVGTGGGSGSNLGAGGGGLAGVFRGAIDLANALLIAGSGGGAGAQGSGGAGGGTSGGAGGAGGGTDSTSGSGSGSGTAGSALTGGAGGNLLGGGTGAGNAGGVLNGGDGGGSGAEAPGGGGGAGRYGGGGGSSRGGGGGSGLVTGSDTTLTSGSGASVANSDDGDYPGDVGAGGFSDGSPGQPGYVLISWAE
ncbi:MAG: hypothetical protein RLN99_05085 [Kiloniellaceae bacterium]